MQRLRIVLNGTVQGVGFRPFVYRTAKDLGLSGFVLNDTSGVTIEVEGVRGKIDLFLKRLHTEKPPLAHIFYEETEFLVPAGYDKFSIRESDRSGTPEVLILPDISTCADCERELLDHSDRRHRYPFINCTNCGPRFTIIERLPYDRPNTTMKDFIMCPECKREYTNPDDRRFHAQPNACPLCGPEAFLTDSDGEILGRGKHAIKEAVSLLSRGGIIALKGIGGFHLICNALDDGAVNTLRRRKRRSLKPFAVMFRGISELAEYTLPTVLEESILLSPARPIVLVKRKGPLLESSAPGLERVGAFLPYSPLHLLLLSETSFPLVATSGNLSDEPIVKDNDEALERLGGLADAFIMHDRPIRRRCDDSVVKVVAALPQIIRRSRGYVPLPVRLPFRLKRKVLALGAHEKNTVSIGMDDRIIPSQHIGDMDTPESMENLEAIVNDLCSLYSFEPDVVVYDLHPGYSTRKWALKNFPHKTIGLQHHHAHILSCMAEHGLSESVTGIAWDGTGYGEDGTLWGGEFLNSRLDGFERIFHFRHLILIGGERAVREPRRVALSILFDLFGENIPESMNHITSEFNDTELAILYRAYRDRINSPPSSSAGRLFDAVSSIIGLLQVCDYEAQAAMMLEDRYDPSVRDYYDYSVTGRIIDWRPLFHGIIDEVDRKRIPSRFINTLAVIAADIAGRCGNDLVCLSGGVFQNDPLTERTVAELGKKGFRVFTHRNIPSNDGGISIGQAVYGGMIDSLDGKP
jgi:hydrogenase maturation protein HypF